MSQNLTEDRVSIKRNEETMPESTSINASRSAREFAVTFTFAVTEASANRLECIAKNGKDNVFATLKKIHPEVSHPKDQTRAKKSTIVCLYRDINNRRFFIEDD